MAALAELVHGSFVGDNGEREGLLGFGIDELAKVEGSFGGFDQ